MDAKQPDLGPSQGQTGLPNFNAEECGKPAVTSLIGERLRNIATVLNAGNARFGPGYDEAAEQKSQDGRSTRQTEWGSTPQTPELTGDHIIEFATQLDDLAETLDPSSLVGDDTRPNHRSFSIGLDKEPLWPLQL